MSAPPALDAPNQDQLFELFAPRPQPAREQRRPRPAPGPSLVEALDAAWNGLRATGLASCPACGGRMEQVAGEGSCGGCGSRLA